MAAANGGGHGADWSETADRIVESQLPGRTDVLARLFTENGSRAPLVIWSPGERELGNPLLMRFAGLCRDAADDAGHLRRSAFDIDAFAALSDWMMVLEVEEGGAAFRYRRYGSGIAEFFGRDMTGRSTADFGGHIAAFFTGIYRAALIRREWVLTEHEPPRQIFVRRWRRLVVPLLEADDRVSAFAVINIPDNELRAGLEIIPDPVFLLDERQVVRFANRAARDYFYVPAAGSRDRTLRDVTGFELSLRESPLDMIGTRAIHDEMQISLKSAVAGRFMVTVNATMHRDSAFYVVIVRLISA